MLRERSQFGCVNLALSFFLDASASLFVCDSTCYLKLFQIYVSTYLTVWSLSCLSSTVPPVGPWACCQSPHPPRLGSETRGTCSSPPAAGVWFYRASSVPRWQSERLLAPSSCHRFQASWTWSLGADERRLASNRCKNYGSCWLTRVSLFLCLYGILIFKIKGCIYAFLI